MTTQAEKQTAWRRMVLTATPPAWLSASVLVLLVGAVYWPTLGQGLLPDDDNYLRGLATLNPSDVLALIWSQFAVASRYDPLTATSFWLENQLWGLDPRGYHALNVLLHGTAALLVWRLLWRLAVPGAWLAAALFAVHPVAVESVAWVGQRQTLLVCVLALASILTYLRFEPDFAAASQQSRVKKRRTGRSTASDIRVWRYYPLSSILYFGALLCQSAAVVLPIVLLIVCWWKRGRVRLRDAVPLAPWLLLGIAVAWLRLAAIAPSGGTPWALPIVAQLLLAGRALWFYAGKLVWPQSLAFFYPHWTIDASRWWQYLFPLGALAVLIGLWTARRRIGRGPLAAALIFLVALVPSLVVVNVDVFEQVFVADRYQYPASIALFALAAAALAMLYQRLGQRRLLAGVAIAAMLIPLAFVAHQRIRVYESLPALCFDAIDSRPAAFLAHQALGRYYRDVKNEQREAVAQYRRVLELQQQFAEDNPAADACRSAVAQTYQDLAAAETGRGRMEIAERIYQEAVRLRAGLVAENASISKYQGQLAASLTDLGLARMRLAQPDEAIPAIEKALELRKRLVAEYPRDADCQAVLAWCHVCRGAALRQSGRTDDAAAAYTRAAKIRQSLAETYPARAEFRDHAAASLTDLGIVRRDLGQFSAAEEAFRKALDLRERLVDNSPSSEALQDSLAACYAHLASVEQQTRGWTAAVQSQATANQVWQRLVESHPEVAIYRDHLATGYSDLGILKHRLGQTSGAEELFGQAVTLRERLIEDEPGNREYLGRLASSFASLAVTQSADGRSADAADTYGKLVDALERMRREQPSDTGIRAALASAYTNLADAQMRCRQMSAVESSLRNAIKVRVQVVQDDPTSEKHKNAMAQSCRELGNLLRAQGRIDDAVIMYQAAVQIRQGLAAVQPSIQSDLTNDLVLCADALALADRWCDSAAAYERAVQSGKHSYETMWPCALAELSCGNEQAYRDTCAELVERYAASAGADAILAIALTLVAGENALDDKQALLSIARRAAERNPTSTAAAILVGAAQYRAALVDEAVATLEQALAQAASDPDSSANPGGQLVAARLLGEAILAMAHRRQTGTVADERLQKVRQSCAKSSLPGGPGNSERPPWLAACAAKIVERQLGNVDVQSEASPQAGSDDRDQTAKVPATGELGG